MGLVVSVYGADKCLIMGQAKAGDYGSPASYSK